MLKTNSRQVKNFLAYLIKSENIIGYGDIRLKYLDHIKSKRKGYKTLGKTAFSKLRWKKVIATEYRLFGIIKFWSSCEITYFYRNQFTITLLKQYENKEQLEEVLIHEFTHLCFFLKKIMENHHENKEWKETLKLFRTKYFNNQNKQIKEI